MSTYFLISGSSLTPGTTLPQTPTTPLCHAFLEGENTFYWPYSNDFDVYVHVPVTHSFSTMKIVGISTIARSDHHVAQTREFECTKVVVPEVIDRGELQNFAVCNYVYPSIPRSERSGGCTWHATCSWALCEERSEAAQLFWHMAWYISNLMYSVVVFSPYVMHYVGTKNVAKELAKITKGHVKEIRLGLLSLQINVSFKCVLHVCMYV